MDETERDIIRKALAARVKEATKNPDKARARLVAEGFYTKSGDLTPQYGGKKASDMTMLIVTEIRCDLCGTEIHTERSTTTVGCAPFQHAPAPNSIRIHGAIHSELCEACAEPLLEAFRKRITDLQAQGRFSPPRFGSET